MVYYAIFAVRVLQAILKSIILYCSIENTEKTHDFHGARKIDGQGV